MNQYGDIWRNAKPQLWDTFYKQEGREHEAVAEFIKTHDDFDSVFELGCGDGRSARMYFADKDYYGVDIGSNATVVAQKQGLPNHKFENTDYFAHHREADLVIAIAVLDNCIRIDDTLDLMDRCANKYILFTNHYPLTEGDEHIEKPLTEQNKLSEKAIRIRFPNVKRHGCLWVVRK